MFGQDLLLLVIAAALVPLAGLLAGVDSALARVSVARVEEMVREDTRGAEALLAVMRDRPRYTNLLLLLRVVAELTATVMVTIVMREQLGGGWVIVTLSVVVMTIVCYVLVGVGPRTLGRQHSYSIALASAFSVRLLGRLVNPLASLLILLGNAITPGRGFREGPFSSEVELRELVDMAEARGVVESDERQMIQSVFDLGDTTVREVMVPRNDVVWIEKHKTVEQALALALRSGFSRLPVIADSIDDVVGVVYLKDLVSRSQAPDRGASIVIENILREPFLVPESKPVDDLLREMQLRRNHIAVIIDEYGGTAGLATIEDILEEIVGEITDEYDRERPPVDWVDADTVRVIARLSVEDLAELFDVELPDDDDDAETVGGLLAQEIGLVPIVGSTAQVGGLELTAENVGGRRNRIDTILVRRLPPPPDPNAIGSPADVGETADAAPADEVGATRSG
jgi:CBS domain containing-hemolysin-like protein